MDLPEQWSRMTLTPGTAAERAGVATWGQPWVVLKVCAVKVPGLRPNPSARVYPAEAPRWRWEKEALWVPLSRLAPLGY